MTVRTRAFRWAAFHVVAATAVAMIGASTSLAQFVVPGTGERVTEVGDNFEEPDWEYTFNLPKSSRNIDGDDRSPTGYSNNGRWFESSFRGQPDVIQLVPTPEGGLPGSTKSLLLQTFQSGVPGRTSSKSQQDDFMLNVSGPMNGYVPVAWSPNFVVRVYMPPFEEWEPVTDTSFGIRADVQGESWSPNKSRFVLLRKNSKKIEPYWPGMFIQFNSKTDPQYDEDYAMFIIRADEAGRDFQGPYIRKPGWWTVGMSFTRDGQVHYFAKPGVEKLTAQDHIASMYPYGAKCLNFSTVFFNVCNQNNGKTWSTKWVIDDPAFYVIR